MATSFLTHCLPWAFRTLHRLSSSQLSSLNSFSFSAQTLNVSVLQTCVPGSLLIHYKITSTPICSISTQRPMLSKSVSLSLTLMAFSKTHSLKYLPEIPNGDSSENAKSTCPKMDPSACATLLALLISIKMGQSTLLLREKPRNHSYSFLQPTLSAT